MANSNIKNVTCLLDKRSKLKDGTFPIKLVVYYERTNKKYGLKVSVTEEDWERLKQPRVKQEILLSIKRIMDTELGRANDIVIKLGKEFTIDLFDALYLDKEINNSKLKEKDLLYSMFDEFISNLRKEERIGNATAYETAKNSLKKFSPDLPIQKVTPQFLQEYENWMVKEGKSITTVGIYLRSFRTIVNIAKDNGYFTDRTYPFGLKAKKKYEIPDGENIKKALPIEDLMKIINAEFKTEEGEFARDLWLFSMYCNGMNMVDIYSLKYSNIIDDFLYFNRTKTLRTKKKQVPISIYISEPVAEIIEKWGNKDKSQNSYIFSVFDNDMTKACTLYRTAYLQL